MGPEMGIVGIIALAVVNLGFLVWMVSSFYKKCPPNQAMIVSGMLSADAMGNMSRVIIGGGSTVFPVIQECRFLSLECMAIELDPQTPYITADGSQLKFKAIAQVKVKSDPASVLTAAEHFLDSARTAETLKEILLGQTRALAGTITQSDVLHDQIGFADKVIELSNESLKKFGMTVVAYSIQEMESDPALLLMASSPRKLI
ncbi:MAG: hypothetical protein C0507_16870 [Cyanobacteria bacterium PR.3.49]|nr:hypothetical protein [Cyanobacteria bacterium PR.3.49]